MAAPIQLKSNKAGGNTFKKSAAAQKPKMGKPATMATKPQLRKQSGKSTAVTTIYKPSTAPIRPKIAGVNSRKTDYSSAWMQTHGLKNAQNGGSVKRLPWATVPADMVGAGSGYQAKKATPAQPKPAKRTTSKSSSGPVKARVKATYTGRNFMNTPKTRIMSARKSA